MRRGRRRMGSDEAEVDMTPMLDIVFIMLIFFIVTATFLDEYAMEISVPPNNDDQDLSEPKPAITVYVDGSSLCSVDGRRTTCDRVPLSVERLKAEKPQANIILRVNKASKHEILVDLKDEFDSTGQNVVIEPVDTDA